MTGRVKVWIEQPLLPVAPITPGFPQPDWPAGLDGEPPLLAATTTGDGVIVATGIATGPVWVEVAAGEPDPQGWEEHAEVQIGIQQPLVIDQDGEEPIVMFTPQRPGRHRVQVWANNRNLNRDLSLSPGTRHNLEEYLFTFTPTSDQVGG